MTFLGKNLNRGFRNMKHHRWIVSLMLVIAGNVGAMTALERIDIAAKELPAYYDKCRGVEAAYILECVEAQVPKKCKPLVWLGKEYNALIDCMASCSDKQKTFGDCAK